MTSSTIVGIDLGTTNSVVAAVVDGHATVLTESGESVLPSVVGVDPTGKLITGVVARNQQVAFPERTVASVKRHMGSMKSLEMGEQNYTPPEISAMILRRLQSRASAALGHEVTRAVITVPAFFDENQRQATREAGQLAGWTVERIINEPTAATLVYHAGSDDRMHLVVYDFGGGTFDVSVVRMESGIIEVLSSKGDTKLGGDDLDSVIMRRVADSFYDEHEIDLRSIASARWRLLQACEAAKCQLSVEEHATIAEEFIAEKDGQPLNLEFTITRSDYEQWIHDFVDRTIQCVDEAIVDAGLTVKQIDELVLVGGTTRTPLIEQRLRSEFNLEPSRAVDPDLAVALGAATQAAMIAGETVGPILVDVTSHTLGVEALDGDGLFQTRTSFSPIIHRGSPLPASYEEAYSAIHESQESARIHVLQGEHSEIDSNTSIGEFDLPLVDPSGDRAKVLVRFQLSLDGTLKVTARQFGNDQPSELVINNALAQFQEEERGKASDRLAEMFLQSDEIQSSPEGHLHDPSGSTVIDAVGTAAPAAEAEVPEDDGLASHRATLRRAQAALGKVQGEDASEIAELAERLEAAIDAQDADTASETSNELDDVLFYVGQ
ncbi:Hsp70 family protein [Allorhodopirellula solitaria]|uniref:Chaperone protein DnaK n=1 Tax=Allorhodopirellula solitaria TaxID=2527987 RepID=A0A5C5XWQ3_9BACT|nr:Hsp70 family protein [Allorhodopirellula solitaria]TWT67108.1 Chaperone protein DnaK [Allorhodopirellula solitaria]